MLCLAVLLWSTESLHGIHPALVALLGGLVVVAPGFGLISLDDAIKKVPWTLLLFMAATLAMSHALTNSGAARYVAEHTLNAGSGTARAVFVLLIIVLSTLAHILIQSRSARSAVLIPMIVMLAPTVGVNPVAAAFISTAAAGFCHTLPASAKPLAMFSTIKEDIPVFTNQQLLRVSMLLLPVHIVSIIIFSFWIWPHLGLPLYL